MKKMMTLLLALVCLLTFSFGATAQAAYLFSPALDAMNCVESRAMDEGYTESYLSEDGLIAVDILTLGANQAGLVGEGSFAGLLELRAEGDMRDAKEIACTIQGDCQTKRIRFETGGSEDAAVVDATGIWTKDATFLYIVQVNADAWYGFREGYEEGAAQAMVDEWLSEIQLGGHDAQETGAQTLITQVADRSCGNADGEAQGMVTRYAVDVEGERDAALLAGCLSALTGLDFSVSCQVGEGNSLTVDWKPVSTLAAGLDGRAQNELFFFYDAVSLNWFMMDSLYATIRENLGVEEVYYTMDGGQELKPTELGILEAIPADLPYMGSAFYFAHSDVKGDEEEVGFEANDYGFYGNYLDTEFIRLDIPTDWNGLYEYEIVAQEPHGYTVVFSEKESGFVFSLEARWFDGEVVQLASVWQGYLGRLSVERLGEMDLLVTYSQPAPDASAAWQIMYEGCREVVDTLMPQENIVIEEGEYIEYQP